MGSKGTTGGSVLRRKARSPSAVVANPISTFMLVLSSLKLSRNFWRRAVVRTRAFLPLVHWNALVIASGKVIPSFLAMQRAHRDSLISPWSPIFRSG